MQVILWSKYHCPNCDEAKTFMQMKGIKFEERKIGNGYTKEELLEEIPTARAVPQIIVDGNQVGGLSNFKKYLEKVETC